MAEKVKIVLGLLLLACIFLPLGSCERVEPGAPDSAVIDSSPKGSKAPVKSKGEVVYLIPRKEIQYDSPFSWFFVLFIWPLPLLFIKRWFLKTKWKRRIGNILELLFACGAGFYIYMIIFHLWFEPTLWGYIATIAIFLYVFIHLVEMFGPYIMLRIRGV